MKKSKGITRLIDFEVMGAYLKKKQPGESLNQYLRRHFGLPPRPWGWPKGKKRQGVRGKMAQAG